MIDRLKNIIAKAKYLTLTITDQGDKVQITATVRPKDGSDPAKPIQVKADWQIADALLVEALNKPPKPGKTEVKKEPKAENSGDLFAAAEAETRTGMDGNGCVRIGTENAGTNGETRDQQSARTEAAEKKAEDESKNNNEEK